MTLVILCRTQGKDLDEFMFRQGSNTAISVLGNIAAEAAGLAHKELRLAAASLRKEKLWALFSSTGFAWHEMPQSAHDITELLNLCSVKPILHFLDSSAESQRFAAIYNDASLIDPTRFCAYMKLDHTFSSVWNLPETNGPRRHHLFYLEREDLFLSVKVNMGETGLQIELVESEERPTFNRGATGAIQKVANFMLHFIWYETLNP